ncbi:hypothetical protein SRHO_G00198320 [Serrasalmus rhombeus]
MAVRVQDPMSNRENERHSSSLNVGSSSTVSLRQLQGWNRLKIHKYVSEIEKKALTQRTLLKDQSWGPLL